MCAIRSVLVLLTLFFAVSSVHADKTDLSKSVDAKADDAWHMANTIWGLAEPGYLERRSSKLIADALEKAGFKVERGVAKIPTAFTATFGEGKPVIGILGEYDALPELSQAAMPFRKPTEFGNGYGHACGHHLFGVASATAAMAIAEQIAAATPPAIRRAWRALRSSSASTARRPMPAARRTAAARRSMH
jgi:aminobenzoyl-glutamate utilization protein B